MSLPDEVEVGETDLGDRLDPTPVPVSPDTAAKEAANLRKGVDAVNGAIRGSDLEGRFPDGTKVRSVTYDPRYIRRSGEPGIDGAADRATGRVSVFGGGATSVRAAAGTYAHELGHFIPPGTDATANQFMNDVLRRLGD